MGTEEHSEADIKLTDSDVKLVLERAVRIDGGEPSISRTDLISAAREAGISEEAVSAAMSQLLASGTIGPQASGQDVAKGSGVGSRLTNWIRVAGSGAVGVLAGFVANIPWRGYSQVDLDGTPVVMIGLLAILTAFRAFRSRDSESQRQFQQELAAMWAGFAAGYGVIQQEFSEDLLYGVGSVWFISSIVGGMIAASKRIAHWPVLSLIRRSSEESDGAAAEDVPPVSPDESESVMPTGNSTGG